MNRNARVLAWATGWWLVLVCVAQAQIELGIDRLQASAFAELQGRRVGLITNPSGVDRTGRSTVDILRQAPGVKLVALFGPEHGVYGTVPAGKYVPSGTDARTGLKIHSLYGPTRKPTPEMLRGLDALVFDLQDLGCRSYTYISTLGLAMEAAAEAGIRMVVLDRPNPLGGQRIEGPRLDPKYRSFVGMFDIPYVYGVTVGELARWINRKHLARPCDLVVIPMKGWRRSMVWEETGLRWVPTSPNIPRIESVRGYVATGLLGEIGVANGANDRLPFELIASEGLNPVDFSQRMNRYALPGVRFEPHSFKPMKGQYTHATFSGARLRIDPKAPANLTSIPFLAYPHLKQRFPQRNYFANRTKDPILMFDKINGSSWPRLALMAGRPATEIISAWQPGVDRWKNERRDYLIYPD